MSDYALPPIDHDLFNRSLYGVDAMAERLARSAVEAASPDTALAAVSGSTNSSLMRRNQVHAQAETSRYTAARLASFRQENSMRAHYDNILHATRTDFLNAGGDSAKQSSALGRLRHRMEADRDEQVRKKAEETHLSQAQEDIEQAAEEALGLEENGAVTGEEYTIPAAYAAAAEVLDAAEAAEITFAGSGTPGGAVKLDAWV